MRSNLISNKKIRLYGLLVAVIALFALAFAVIGFGMRSTHAYAAEGSMVDYADDAKIDAYISLDVNGSVNAGEENDRAAFRQAEGNPVYRKRTIAVNALSDAGSTFTLRSVSDIYNYSDAYFSIEGKSFNGGETYEYIEITALRYTGDLARTPRIALVLEHTTNDVVDDSVTILIQVDVQASAPSLDGAFYVGNQIDSTGKGEIPATDIKNYVAVPVVIKNYTKTLINLETYLKGRKLYAASSSASDSKESPTGAGANWGVLTDSSDDGAYLAFDDLSDYYITDVVKTNVMTNTCTIEYPTVTEQQPLTSRRSFSIAADFSSRSSAGASNIWYSDSGYSINLEIKLRAKLCNQDRKKEISVYLPIALEPNDSPQAKNTFSMDTSLNVSSEEVATTADQRSVAGFKTVRIRPEFLCNFPAYEKSEMLFDGSKPIIDDDKEIKSSPYIDISVAEDGSYYDITGVANGSVELTFNVLYKLRETAPDYDSKPVKVAFTVYGDYPGLIFDIKGRKVKTYTINDFTQLKEDGYRIVGAEPYKDDESYSGSCATISFDSNGTLSVTPHENYQGGKFGIKLSLVNIEGRRIELKVPMQVELDGGTWWYTLSTIEKVLFLVGIGLAAVLLILLIVWLLIRSIHRHKLDELQTSAPTSAYIIKLNSTIAAAQAQQRIANQSYASQQSQMLALGAGPTTTAAPNPNTLALGATPQTSVPLFSTGAVTPPPPPPPMPPVSGQPEDFAATNARMEEIYIPISDEELLQRIYEEKFEPRGMLKRTFDKSKDLQQRELEKEKERIRDDVRNGMSIEEACKSPKQRGLQSYGVTNTFGVTTDAPEVKVDPLIEALGFDPGEPIFADIKREEPSADWSEEEKKLKEAEYNNMRLHAELSIIETRIEAIAAANEKTEANVSEANNAIGEIGAGIREAEQRVDDKNTDLSVERRKSAKEALNKEIAELEAKIKADKEAIAGKKADVENGTELLARIKEVSDEYAGKKEATEALVSASDIELESARAEVQRLADLAAKAKAAAELKAHLEILNPMMTTVNTLDGEIRELDASVEQNAKSKDSLKTRVAALQTEMLSTTDATKIGELNEEIKALNKDIADIDRTSTANTTLKTNKNIEMSSARRKANEYIDKEQIELGDIITAEDRIIGQIALDKLRAGIEAEKAIAEQNVTHWQNECETLTGNLDTMVAEAAASVAERIQAAESELSETQGKLSDLVAAIEACDNDDEKLNLTMEQATLQEEVERLTAATEEMRAEGIKANLECKMKGEADIENAREELEHAKEAFEKISERYNEVSTNVNPLDLIVSGSGIISQDRKKIEAENYKKKLEESQNAIEQAKMQAQLAQAEAERAIADAQRASDESKAEAERIAQEAMLKAEAAREEAEQKAREEAERVRLEAEEAKRLAQEEVEKVKLEAEEARRLAEEEAERVRLEAEESKRLAEEEAEKARKSAEEEAERARLEAEESKRLAQEEAEKARKAAEEEAERVRLEAEEAKRLEAEEAEKARKAAEEEAQKQSEEEAKRKARIDEKVAKRKEEIAKLRDELKNITEEEQGAVLREKFYQMQLGLDEDEKTSSELNDLLNKSMDDASHAAELSRYKKLANQKPKRIVKKVTERVNKIPRKKPVAGARPAGARPAARPGARPAGARPAARPGARPAGARPAARPGARPAGARPPVRPGARPTGSRPSGTRPTPKR